ncbi:MAG: alkaline phosphatase family protein [Candidatus Cybelea sp.]
MFLAVVALAGCAPSTTAVRPFAQDDEIGRSAQGVTMLPYMQSGAALRALDETGAGKIAHVVYIVQENRSFDNLFQGYPGADTLSSGKNSDGETITLQPVSLKTSYEIDHSAQAMFAACDGTGKLPGTDCHMDGFNKEGSFMGPKNPEYVYVPHRESKPYFDMAHEWVVADRMFQSQLDESFVAHQYVIAAQAAWSVNLPSLPGGQGCEALKGDRISTITKDRTLGPQIRPCFDYTTLADELDKAKLSWRFYASKFGSASSGNAGEWSSFASIEHIRDGPDWKNVISPNWKFITDVRKGKLANFTWVMPVCAESDHVNCGGGYGPSWVAALVNTVGQSKFWDSTAIFVQWDDWGGLYDHVAPRYYDRDSLGFRVPLLVISPYAKQNHVSHVHYETAGVLRFAEDLWGLDRLAAADKRANSPAKDCFDFKQKARRFMKIEAPRGPDFFMRRLPNDYFAPDYE